MVSNPHGKMALVQGLHFRDFAARIRPWLCPSGELEWWTPPFDPSYNNFDAEARFCAWRAKSAWFVYVFTETECCNWLELEGGIFRRTWTVICIARAELCQDYYQSMQGFNRGEYLFSLRDGWTQGEEGRSDEDADSDGRSDV